MKIRMLIFFGCWLAFYVGFATSMLLQAKASISSSSNALTGFRDWFKLNWHVAWAQLATVTAVSGAILHFAPSIAGIGMLGDYYLVGFFGHTLADKVLFIWGSPLGLKVEVPQIAPPPGK